MAQPKPKPWIVVVPFLLLFAPFIAYDLLHRAVNPGQAVPTLNTGHSDTVPVARSRADLDAYSEGRVPDLMLVPSGTPIIVLERGVVRTKVRVGDKEGWVPSEWVK